MNQPNNPHSIIDNPNFWEQRYQEGSDRWDIGKPAPPFVSFLNSPQKPPTGRTLVLGCGRGYDALLFASQGFEVWGVDFAPSAINDAKKFAAELAINAQFLQRDIFDLTSEFAENFDLIVEHTCFCAIPLEKRPDYVKLVRSLLRPGGELIGLFFTHSRPNGPPFGVTPAQIEEYFLPDLELISLMPVNNSIPSRQGEEHFGRFRK